MWFVSTGSTASPLGSPNSSPTRLGRGSAHTPGEEHRHGDEIFKDDLMTYEINGIKMKVHLRKHPTFSREKIDHFNRVRYGSSADGSHSFNLLPLPQHLVTFIMPDTPAGQMARKPESPLTLSQNQIFDHIMTLTMEEILANDAGAAERARNDLFFYPQPSSPSGSPKQRRRRKTKGATEGDGDGFSQSGKGDCSLLYSSASDSDGESRNRVGVSFRDDAYGVQDEEDDVDEAVLHTDSLQGYDFVRQRRNAASMLQLPK
jgi:hypothetical protein